MSGFSNPLVGGGGALVYPNIHSPNFTAEDSGAYTADYQAGYGAPPQGWSIDKNGNAQFNDLTLTGNTFSGNNYELNPQGAFFYSGPPALGNLIASFAGLPGTDPFNNTYLAGMITYVPSVAGTAYAQGSRGGQPVFAVSATGSGGDWQILSNWLNIGGLLNGFTNGTDLNGTSDPVQVRQIDGTTIQFRGRVVTPSSGPVNQVTIFSLSAAGPYTLPATLIRESPANNVLGGQNGSILLRPDGNVQVNGNFGTSSNIIFNAVLFTGTSF